MIQRLSIKNFKSWANLENMEFGKVTAVFGPNSSGKTSLIQFLLMLKQTAESRDRRILNLGGTERDYVDLGSYEDVVYSHDAGKNISFEVVFNFEGEPNGMRFFEREYAPTESLFGASFIYKDKRILLDSLKVSPFSTDKTQQTIASIKWSEERNGIFIAHPNRRFLNKNTPISDYSLFDINEKRSGGYITLPSESLYDIPFFFKESLSDISYLGPLREYPKREYRWTGEVPQSIGISGEYAVQAMLSKIQTVQPAEQAELIKDVSKWLKRFEVIDELDLASISETSRLFELKIKSKNYAHWANLVDVGFGVSQVLPVIVLAYFAPPGSLIILEQPEIHLHPRVQAELADLFLEVALTRNVQFFIESHSEHLLMRLQRRIAERSGEFSDLTEDDVKLYFCKRETEASTLEPLEMDEYGRIKNWPKDFFGDPLGERAAMTQAMLARKMAASGKNGHTNLNS